MARGSMGVELAHSGDFLYGSAGDLGEHAVQDQMLRGLQADWPPALP